MATSAGTSNIKKPWAWLAALATFGLALASSTALYVVNPVGNMPLSWWTAVVAPALVYGLVLPLCVPRIRIGGWLIGFFTLAVLHVGIGLATAWLYATVSFTSFEQALAPALWGFPPALVLAMVGSLVMALPFLGALAPRAAAPRPPAEVPLRTDAAKKTRQAPEIVPAKDRQAWARGSAGAGPAPAAVTAARVTSAPPAAVVAAPVPEEPPVAVPDEPAVHSVPLLGVNGAASDAAEADQFTAGSDDLPPAAAPDLRQALSELFGAPASGPVVDEPVEAPEELVAAEPAFTAAAAVPVASEAVVRISFDRVVGQLPPEAFQMPLGQVGARLLEAGTLVVPQAVVVPQLGEGVVQVAWEVVVEQFPAAVFALAPAEVKERIVNGRLLLPLDEIVRQLPPDVFATSIGRGPVEVPGLESFPAPFRPQGWEEPPVAAVPPPGRPEPMSIEVPDAAEVARDLAWTPPEPEVRVEEIEPVPAPSESDFAGASLLEEVRPVRAEETPDNVLEIEEVAEVLDLDSLLEGARESLAPEAEREPGPVVDEPVEAPEELVAAEPAFTAAAAVPVASEAVVRISFDRVVGQLPPEAFQMPLGQVGARLLEAGTLVVPQAVVVPQLGEGVVQVAWEVVVEQFPAAVFALAPAEVKERIVNGRLLLPLDEIVRQLPPDVFATSIGRGPVEVPGLESFPAPFRPQGREEPSESAVAEPRSVAASAPPALPSTVPELERPPEPEPVPVAAEAPVKPPVIERRYVSEPLGNAERLAALLAPWETAALDEVQVGDFAIISVSAAGLPGSVVAAAAGHLSSLIARRAPRPVEQATLRGTGGTLVLTPVGSGWNTGMALAVGVRPGGPLARLEILARRAAAAHEPPSPAESRQTVPQSVPQSVPQTAPLTARFDAAPLPPAAAAAEEDLEAFGPLTAQSFREPVTGALIHCFVPLGVSAAELAPFAWDLAQAMAQGPQAGPLGSFHSTVLRSGRERLEIRRLPSASGPAPVLVVEGADTGRPGLVRLQVDRAAARLSAA